ncbi:putative RNA-directed DNA polymerase from transposon BS [Trichonephila clavipes]|nr:putative RNA-directed DNA polymerase from transposon BS [Trichonephila clavipes]
MSAMSDDSESGGEENCNRDNEGNSSPKSESLSRSSSPAPQSPTSPQSLASPYDPETVKGSSPSSLRSAPSSPSSERKSSPSSPNAPTSPQQSPSSANGQQSDDEAQNSAAIFTGVIETSRNITARVIERDTSGEIYYFLEDSKISRRCEVGLFADDIVLWNSNSDVVHIETAINTTLSDIQIFAEQHKLIFNVSKSTSSFFMTNRRLYNYQPQIFMESKSLPYEKHPKYLGYILDPEILSNKHIDYVINKGRKRLDLLKYIAGRDWGADAGTLRLTYTSLIRPVLEYGSQIYFSASCTNLAKLDRVQSSAARIITGMRHSCPTDLVLFEADIMPLDLRRKLLLSKYFCKLYSYGDYNCTSAYLITWTNRHRLKRDSPFSQMQTMDLLDQDIEEHFLKNVFNSQEGLPRVHFKPEMEAHTSKNQDPPEYLRQLALEIINKIPATAIYADGSKDDQNSCGSGIFIKAPNCSHNIKIRNPDFCSVFRSELIAIDEALRIIKTVTSPDEIWILCDSRSAIQHLSDWTNIGDKTSVSILKNLKELSQQHEIYFQWIPSHIGLFGNDTADLLAKEGVIEDLMSRRTLTFSEIFSKTKSLIQELWKTPPTHPWYNRQAPGGALSIKMDRVVQTTISRLASGHTRGLSFHLGQKIYENCTKCNLVQATADHLLFCAGLDREDIYSSPLLVYDFLRAHGPGLACG